MTCSPQHSGKDPLNPKEVSSSNIETRYYENNPPFLRRRLNYTRYTPASESGVDSEMDSFTETRKKTSYHRLEYDLS